MAKPPKLEPDWKIPLSFMFEVSFTGPRNIDAAAFQEVSGLNSAVGIETVVEGGENAFVHQLPKQTKHGPLKLKRGMMDDGLFQWCRDTIEGGLNQPIEKMDLVVKATDRGGEILRAWSIKGAWPMKWDSSSFDATKSEMMIETLELAYNTIEPG